MEKSADAFRTISEVAEDLDLPQHVLRFWETRFAQIKPLKRAGGRRFYRPADIELLRAIRQLLYGEGYTIKGVQKILKEQGVQAIIAAGRANGTPHHASVATPPHAAAAFGQRGEINEAMLDFGLDPEGGAGGMPYPAESCEFAADAQGESACGLERDSQAVEMMEQLLTELVECQRILEIARRG